ncbi:unnamed protein product [Rotaria sordida]|uniref:RING-type domain-containing protein n=2 Tax=Rotaria sordida TaxID=392033 RepID=A0A818IAT0_9BILA|nr:unnamed protein product [Rotaria sordida]
MNASSKQFDKKKEDLQTLASIRNRIQSLAKSINRPGVHSTNYMSAAGFEYTGNGDTARCKDCGLEVSDWTLNMNPFTIHSIRQPNCSFVCSMMPVSLSNKPASSSSSTPAVRSASASNEQENPSKRQKIETTNSESLSNTLFESDLLQQVRRHTFSHWSHRTIPSSIQMIEAGFFHCNLGDRVICIYCNLICQQWKSHTDDPCEIHKTLSPNCIYVKAKLMHPVLLSASIVNENLMSSVGDNCSSISNNLDPLQSNDIILTASCNPAYSEISKRLASFATWPNEDLPSVDDLVRAGFFYTGTKTIVTCFYCNGSLHSWGPNDNPIIEHARWFPHCAYARQLCGDDLYRKIQESKRAQQERARANEFRERIGSNDLLNTNLTTNSQQLLIPDDCTLSRLVAARLDLPMSQRLLDQNFKLSIIKRCWEDQLRIKGTNFVSECDLYIACLILQKQIEHINGIKENIVIPSVRMKQIREQTGIVRQEEEAATLISCNTIRARCMNESNNMNVEMATPLQSSHNSILKSRITENQNETKKFNQITGTNNNEDQLEHSTPYNPCITCLTEEKRIACLPCGHFTVCVSCSTSLQLCPKCQQKIIAFVRIYV